MWYRWTLSAAGVAENGDAGIGIVERAVQDEAVPSIGHFVQPSSIQTSVSLPQVDMLTLVVHRKIHYHPPLQLLGIALLFTIEKSSKLDELLSGPDSNAMLLLDTRQWNDPPIQSSKT